MAELAAFLREASSRRFAWGVSDCLLFPSDWVKLATGVDPSAAYRGRYRTQLGAMRHLAPAGGLLALTRREMAAAGFTETDAPAPGDVGVVEAIVEDPRKGHIRRPLGAIRSPGGRWVTLGARGIAAFDFPLLAAWRVLPPA